MRKYNLYQVDSFTKELFKGNPAGVVPSADGLSEANMKLIARELNNSETAFVFSANTPDHDVHIRFFTPTTEVPSCGHATIAAHYVRAHQHKLGNCVIIQKTAAGLMPIEIIPDNDDYSIAMTQGAISFEEPFLPTIQNEIISAIGLSRKDLDARCPIQIVSTGHSKIMIGIKHNETLQGIQPDLSRLKQLSAQTGCNGFFVFTLEKISDGGPVHGRMFAPAIGIAEDPVTGNANGPLGAYLVQHKLVRTTGDTFEFLGIQGEAVGRKGQVRVMVAIKEGLPQKVTIIGNAVIVFNATIDLNVNLKK